MIGSVLAAIFDFLLLIGVGVPWFVARRLRGREDSPLRERLGGFEDLPETTSPRIWLHAVSVGEVLALRTLIREVRLFPSSPQVVLTVTTPKGLETARATYPEGVLIRPSPVDLAFAVRRAFRKIRPSVAVLAECELWPQWLRRAHLNRVPVVVVNARISERSVPRYRLLRAICPWIFSSPAQWLAQSEAHVARLVSLGVPASRVTVAGNIKADNVEFMDPAALRRAQRSELGISAEAPVVIAGSTHPPEHGIILQAFHVAWKTCPAARLLIAPRHMDRVPDLLLECQHLGLSASRWTERAKGSATVCVIDTMGALANLYACADIALLGGTWTPVGGHNPLEPARFGIPIVVGSHVSSIKDLVGLLAEAGALDMVPITESLGHRLIDVCRSPAAARQRGSSAARVIERSRGATALAVAAIKGTL